MILLLDASSGVGLRSVVCVATTVSFDRLDSAILLFFAFLPTHMCDELERSKVRDVLLLLRRRLVHVVAVQVLAHNIYAALGPAEPQHFLRRSSKGNSIEGGQ